MGIRWILVVFALLYVAVATFPGDYRTMSPGLDPSWTYALNTLSSSGALFGRDVVFTFGPLGYLLNPQHVGTNLVQAAGLWILTQAAIVLVAVYHFVRDRRTLAVLAFAAGFLIAHSFGLIFEDRLLLVIALLLTIGPEDNGAWRVAAPLAAGGAGALLFIKFTAGIGAAAMVALAAAVWVGSRRVPLRRAALFLGLPWVLAVGILTLVLLKGFGALIAWLSSGIEIVRGFSSAMAVGESAIIPALALGAVAIAILGGYVIVRSDPRLLSVALPLLAMAYVAFRHSFVRHHGRFVTSSLLAALAVLGLCSRSGRRLLVVGGTALLMLIPGVALSLQPECGCPWWPRGLWTEGWEDLVALVRWDETVATLDRTSELELAEDRLPDSWLRVISPATGGVDAVPWEISFMPANDLPWVPNPVIQTYHAYTAKLDRSVAEHFSSTEAPRYILLSFFDIDGRHPMFASPATWRSIMASYEPAGPPPTRVGPNDDLILLRRRPEKVPIGQLPNGRTSTRVGQWIDVPTEPGLVFGRVELRPTLTGRLTEVLWRTEALYVDLDYGDGGFVRVRALPGTLGQGLLLNRPPLTADEFVDLLQGTLPRQVLRFRLAGPGAGSFDEDIQVVWSSARWAPGPPG